MKIFINNDSREVPEKSSITSVLNHLEIPADNGIAVALNQQVIPRTKWNETPVAEQDKILLVKITQGG